ncbi:MAG: YaaR family protein [Tissierellales bacterium]|jgi:uncharacterized protein YaaR (DUF327 family)|nr:YaaR family protein [Tissierellales bacterium]
MKIDKIKPSSGVSSNQKAGEIKSGDSVVFQEMMNQKREDRQNERFNELLDHIDKQGKKLAEKQTIANLIDYKKMVKEFVSEAVDHGLKLEKQGGFRRGGRSKIFKIVKKIDEKLLDLTDEILDNEKKGLDVLSCVGEIQGLLINIYT